MNIKNKCIKYKIEYSSLKENSNINLFGGNIDKNSYYILFNIWLNKNYNEFIPYSYIEKKVITDENQNVRNVATLYDILQLNKFNKINEKLYNKIEKNIEFYLSKFYNNKKLMRQASAFLLLALYNLDSKKYKKDILNISNYLYKSLYILERQFELGEVLMALALTINIDKLKLNDNISILLKEQEKMHTEIKNLENNPNNIFQYNWHIKFLHSMHIKNIGKNKIKDHAILLKNKILDILPQIKNEFNETNYLAVSFEALTSASIILKNFNLNNEILEIFNLLKKRYSNGLFYFKNKQARLDITGHVLNGLFIF